MPQQARYRFRLGLPYWFVRGRDTTIYVDLYDDETGEAAAPTAATCAVVEPDGTSTAIAGVSVAGNRLSATVLSTAVAADDELSSRWLVRWTATVGGVEYAADNPAHVCRREPLSPVVADDLRTRHQVLRELRTRDKTNTALLHDAIRDSFEDILRRLLDAGRDPDRILSSAGIFNVILWLAMAHAFMDAASSLNSNGTLAELGAHYERRAEKAWDLLKLAYDKDGDGLVAQDERYQSGTPVIFAGVRRWPHYTGSTR